MTHVHAGARLLTREVVEAIPEGVVSIEEAVYKPLIARRQLRPYITSQRFFDIGTPERLMEFRSFAAASGLNM
jgi:NDP-sugar pyrophosphorylase family protein